MQGEVMCLTPETRLPRGQCAQALTQAGFPITPATLATKASRGGGPEYEVFGRTAFYVWGKAFRWAQDCARRHDAKPRAWTRASTNEQKSDAKSDANGK
jgi:hypothetical protein